MTSSAAGAGEEIKKVSRRGAEITEKKLKKKFRLGRTEKALRNYIFLLRDLCASA
jgi:hypothetical protein